MANPTRLQRINEEILRELGTRIPKLKDPRIQGLVSVTRVEVTGDLSVAKVYVSALEGDSREMIKGFHSAAGFLRREIGQALGLRHIPELQFIADDSIQRGTRIMELLHTLDDGGKQS